MGFDEHLRITGSALKNWFVAQLQVALVAAGIWLSGLWIAHVPLAPAWACLAFFFHFIPVFGALLSLLGPAVAAAISGGLMRLVYVLILYAVVAVVEGFVLEPVFMKHAARVPVWATVFVPIVMGIVFNFWGVLLSAPLLAVFYAYRSRRERRDLPRMNTNKS